VARPALLLGKQRIALLRSRLGQLEYEALAASIVERARGVDEIAETITSCSDWATSSDATPRQQCSSSHAAQAGLYAAMPFRRSEMVNAG
jgi:hypothetical protein